MDGLDPDKVAEAILDAGPGGKAERYVPRPTGSPPRMRVLAPGLTAAPSAAVPAMTPATGSDERDR